MARRRRHRAGITAGPLPAAIGGALVGTGRVAGAVLNGVDDFSADRVASLVSTVGFYATYGGVVLKCRRHHHLHHQPGWRDTLLPDGTYIVTDPAGTTRTTRPPDPIPLADTG